MNFSDTTSKSELRDRIYVVEDDPDVSHLIGHNLNAAGYDVSKFSSAEGVISAAEATPPSLFLLDIMMPGINGFDLCSQIRQHDSLRGTPVIFLSARTEEDDRLQAFNMGADGYMTKPFSPRELIVRIRNLIRIQKLVPSKEVLRVGDIEMNLASLTLRVGGTTIPTTVREFRLLEYMIRNRGHVFRRDQLLDAVWKDGCSVTPRSIDVFVRRLREKIETDPRHPYYLRTHRGIGYRFACCR
jgi:DNA-binding response OmpR family regulator